MRAKIFNPSEGQSPSCPFPWVTALVVALALLVTGVPGWAAALAYDRAGLSRGEIWRLWTGHLVHFSASHLGWDLLVVAFVGTWVERADFRGGRWLWFWAPPLVSLVLLLGEPALVRYGGLSGLATAAVVFACLSEWRRAHAQRNLWLMLLALVALKIGVEFITGHNFFTRFDSLPVRAVPLSHAAGFAAAIACWLTFNGSSQAEEARPGHQPAGSADDGASTPRKPAHPSRPPKPSSTARARVERPGIAACG